ncbi:MAG TPA: hypothetical protein VGS19_29615 [Streptosporangiaceae bacterium]|nr:hypothetical protein [Streptosporangiaceae bacterium]
MTDLDLRPERRDLLASWLCVALTAVIPASQAGLRGSLAYGTADRYSDIDVVWAVPDGSFLAAAGSAVKAAGSVHPVSSMRIDPALAMSRRRRLVFIPLGGRAAVLACGP